MILLRHFHIVTIDGGYCTVGKGYSAGNYQILDKESTGRMEFRRDYCLVDFRSVTIPGTLTLKDLYSVRQIFQNLNMEYFIKMKNNTDPALLRG
jgi:hypothetical protein